jgi:hypothetical protein
MRRAAREKKTRSPGTERRDGDWEEAGRAAFADVDQVVVAAAGRAATAAGAISRGGALDAGCVQLFPSSLRKPAWLVGESVCTQV